MLSQLATMGSLDPQVALLLRQYAGYCKFVHFAHSTPPSCMSDRLALFDADAWHFLTGIDTSGTEWLQVQMSLSRSCSLAESSVWLKLELSTRIYRNNIPYC